MEGTRRATHAGSWYSGAAAELDAELGAYLAAASSSEHSARLLIAPHAGYSYSGPTAAWGYRHVRPEAISTVFLLGPSHHAYLQGCQLPCSAVYATPLGNLSVNVEVVEALRQTRKFGVLKKKDEEKEHSLEMHLPYIRKVFQEKEIGLVPIMVGDVDLKSVREYGRIFARYLADPSNLFVVSTDFCHWGDNFDYKPYDRSKGMIFEFIEDMDRTGMRLIEGHDLEGFSKYLHETGNTICGCNPIMVALSTIQQAGIELTTRFVRYAQSNQVRTSREFSVSYAASVTFVN
jgi:MEMO1 family protein